MAEIPPVSPVLPMTSPKKVKPDKEEGKWLKKRPPAEDEKNSRLPHIDERV